MMFFRREAIFRTVDLISSGIDSRTESQVTAHTLARHHSLEVRRNADIRSLLKGSGLLKSLPSGAKWTMELPLIALTL